MLTKHWLCFIVLSGQISKGAAMTMVVVNGKLITPESLERFLQQQIGTWFSVETISGIEAVTDDRTAAFAFLDEIASFFPWVVRWEDGERDYQSTETSGILAFT